MNEFKQMTQYVCISSAASPPMLSRPVYIQIILQKIVNKKTYFMKRVAGSSKLFR